MLGNYCFLRRFTVFKRTAPPSPPSLSRPLALILSLCWPSALGDAIGTPYALFLGTITRTVSDFFPAAAVQLKEAAWAGRALSRREDVIHVNLVYRNRTRAEDDNPMAFSQSENLTSLCAVLKQSFFNRTNTFYGISPIETIV